MRNAMLYAGPLLCLIVSCGGTRPPESTSAAGFSNPQRVTIRGYADHAMEPSISRDGRYLFFNNSNDPTVNTNLHWAERIDDLTFDYRGEIAGVNTASLDAVASMDTDGVFYFVSTRSYSQTASTLFRGNLANGGLSGVELVPGVSTATPGIVDFDAEISPDGNTLYFVEGRFGASGQPQTADILIATRSGGSFVRDANGAKLMQQVNTPRLEYAPAIARSGLELFFTRVEGNTPAIFTATRTSTTAPFSNVQKVSAITGHVEAPTLSPDEKSLYYHMLENDKFVLYRVTRQ